ncbi:MAG: DNA gyrase subunit A [Candidatus Kaiserbacteria bacterium]|nr:DNA gyrase subunit A [Candidatus Kaiserbacteria bacterium]
MAEDTANQHSKIFNKDITEEMRSAYLDYAMSVITARALPDVQDGLKPVQRRILYAMFSMGLRHAAKTRKSATVVGETLGKYHPHGNLAVYEAMAKMTQNFVTRYPLVTGQGNFGSIDGDPPAAERYTEAKMSAYAEKMMEDIEKKTVDFTPNYENTLEEPKVLPAKAPNLLVNGTLGIAVGMATDIPPHNLREVCDALICLIENPDASTEDLLQHIKGPDFPMGAIAYDKKAIAQAYATGRGGVLVRGEVEIVEGKKGVSLLISSIPYRVNKARLIEKIGELVRNKKIEGIKDLRDESTDDIRIAIELKANAQPHRLQNALYKHTQLEETYHYNIVGLLNGIPQTLTLHQLLQAYIDHRRVIVERAIKFDLTRAKDRAHIVEGLKEALDHIDKIITLIRKSREVSDARKALMKAFKFSEVQANAILEMRLQKLAGLERKKVEDELENLQKTIKRLEGILQSKKKIDEEVKKGIQEVKELFGDDRRTKIISQAHNAVADEDLIPEKRCIIMITGGGYIKRTTNDEYKRQRRGGVGTKGAELKEEDFTTISISASSHDILYFFTDKGKVYQLKAYEIPEARRTGAGRALVNFIEIDADERVTSIVPVAEDTKKNAYLFFATQDGTIKKVAISQFENIRKTGIIAISLDRGDQLVNTMFCANEDTIILVSRDGKAIRFSAKEVRASGRSAKGVRGIRLGKEDAVIGALVIPADTKMRSRLLTISEKGYGKQTKADSFKIQKRGGSGIKAAEVATKTGKIVGIHILLEKTDDELITMSKKGQMVRMATNEIPERGRQTQGVRVMKLKGDDILTASTMVQQ